MNFTNHLKKLNETLGMGTKAVYSSLVCAYVLSYWLRRSVPVSLWYGNRYGRLKKLFYTLTTGGYDHLNEIDRPLENRFNLYNDVDHLNNRGQLQIMKYVSERLDQVKSGSPEQN